MTDQVSQPPEMSPQGYWQIATTLASEAEALQLAQAIVERRLAACVQVVGPITSVYRWQGAMETSREWQCLIKTPAACYDELASTILELHAYDVPELIATEIVAGSPTYLAWIAQETRAE
jgi:periplasmic divalent cation tolerance protein